MTTTPLRIAIIGAGQMAGQHARAVMRRGGAAIVGVHDRAPERSRALAAMAESRAFPTVAALLAQTQPDVVHVCTPPAAHFEAAHQALDAGAHVYVEKPFALTSRDARALLALAAVRHRLVCAGHQLLYDRGFTALMARAPALGTLVQADSHFAFRPVGGRGARALAEQTIDILPHPLYSLIAVLERFGTPGAALDLRWAHAGPEDVQAVLEAGGLVGRLSVSLRARPVASSLTLLGTGGSLTCDFVRSMVVGAGNAGTEALEKILNPVVEGAQLVSRSATSLARRLSSGVAYPGLFDLVDAFYRAVENEGPSPLSPGHLLRVSELFEQLAVAVHAAAPCRTRPSVPRAPRVDAPLTVVTGASGFLGRHIVRALPRVRGIGRGAAPDDLDVADWVAADLGSGLAADAVAGAGVVVHAAAETAGGYDAHERNTIDGTRHLLRAMADTGVRRLVLVSSLSVLRPPRAPWERQHEHTGRPADPRIYGAYSWGKCLQEELVEREARALGIAVRIIRPGALIDPSDPEVPGLMGRRLFGAWHLGLGRPGLPIAVCDVRRCAQAIAWCAAHFDEAPPVVNLFDPLVATRGAVLDWMRARQWTGRVVWVPISLLAAGVTTARAALSLAHGRLPERLAAWAVLRPRRYDDRLAASLLDRAAADVSAAAADVAGAA